MMKFLEKPSALEQTVTYLLQRGAQALALEARQRAREYRLRCKECGGLGQVPVAHHPPNIVETAPCPRCG